MSTHGHRNLVLTGLEQTCDEHAGNLRLRSPASQLVDSEAPQVPRHDHLPWRRATTDESVADPLPPRLFRRFRTDTVQEITGDADGDPRRPRLRPGMPVPGDRPASATGRASSPGVRPRISRRSGRWRKPCARLPWSEAADPPTGAYGERVHLPVGDRMGSPQDANPRVSSAPIARSRKPLRPEDRGCPDDKRTLVTHSLDDGRSSWAGRRASLTPPIRPPIAPSLRRPGSPIPARQRGRLRRVHAPGAPAASADPVRPPALPDRYRRPTLGRGFGADPGAGERGPRRDTGAQRTIS